MHAFSRSLFVGLVALAGCAGNGNETPVVGSDSGVCVGAACEGLCTRDAECPMGRRCDLDHHVCVACVVDADCAAGSACDLVNHECAQGCSPMRGCGDAGVCQADGGVCVECLADPDCKDARRPVCDGKLHHCAACLPGADHCAAGTYCALKGNDYQCAPGCKNDGDCAQAGDGGVPGASHCDVAMHQCVACLVDDDCPMGTICKAGVCAAGCSAQRGCANGLTCCNGNCSDPTSDPANCGSCGAACAGGFNCCHSTCANPINELMNCGGCGVVCHVVHGTPACTARACGVATCDAGWDDCNGVYKDGCETHTDVNAANCGGCGNACSFPHALPACAGGACKIDSCIYPWADCNGQSADGCETATGADAKNCGACGKVCGSAHATAECDNGQCAISACDAGFADCDHWNGNGCETGVASDLRNCGACGLVCGGANGMASCAMGVCQIACSRNFGDCDKDRSNGCEASLLTDVTNCGACGVACVAAHGKAACAGGGCAVTACDFGWADCNHNAGDGCEADLLNQPTACGQCGMVCSNNHIGNPSCGVGLCNGACDFGFADCDGNKQTNGCEINTQGDANNCGQCGMVCPGVANGAGGCAAGICGVSSCNGGFGDCDKVVGNGCEANLTTDVNNCGACGKACAGGQQCVGGACSNGYTNGMGGFYSGNGATKLDNARLGCESFWGVGACCNDGCGSCNNRGYHKCGTPNCNGSTYWDYDNTSQDMSCGWVSAAEILVSYDGKNWVQ